MAKTVDFSVDDLARQLDATPEQIYNGARRGMQDVLNDWQREARDDAPIRYGELRRQIKQTLDADSLDGKISNNVYEDGFNYSYWQHEVRGHKYIDNVAETNEDEWFKNIEKEIEIEVEKAGW